MLAYRHWLPNPRDTIGVRLTDEAMHPILPAGSIVAVDRSVTDPRRLNGQIVAARPNREPMIRWLDVSGRHVILAAQSKRQGFPADPRRVRPRQEPARHRPGRLVLEPIWPSSDADFPDPGPTPRDWPGRTASRPHLSISRRVKASHSPAAPRRRPRLRGRCHVFCFLLAFVPVASDPEASRPRSVAGRRVGSSSVVSEPAFRDGFN